ncbi:hypothetical protein B0O99DRAFT_610467 [Bisporella sp. PMI_857]|nr:hypothetical protein B0O99DRAFT_612739 [Bisporella sp. PMI_857]KAH8600326.1 hypothetical protein B0O99DRAFT_610467 [Bisporella sp. PMI_857]
MAFSRVAAMRSCFRTATRSTAVRPQLFRQVARRGYASSGHGETKASGDAVWAAGAVAVTIPSCWWLLSNAEDASHGHDDHGDSHGKPHHKEGGEEDEAKDETKDEADETEDKKDNSEKPDDSDSEGESRDTPDTSEDEGESEKKDGNKKHLESDKGVKQGQEDDKDEKSDNDDEPAASKSASDKTTQSGKQEGLTNTDTKRSTDISNNADKSKKTEGGPDSAKLKGTVNPSREQK